MVWFGVFVVLLALVATGMALLSSHRRMQALRRVEELGLVAESDRDVESRPSPLITRHRWLAFITAAVVTVVLSILFAWPFWLAIAFGFVIGAIAWIAEDFWAVRTELLVEEQIADTIDMMVSALRAGTSLVDAVGIAAEESRRPLRRALDDVVRRLRLGDNPDAVFDDFGWRVGTETAQVLAFCLTVHWRVGGSLAPALATVSIGARHRIEFARRVRSQATESRVSLIGMLGITYMLTLLLWKAYPERFEGFFTSEIGIGMTATVVFLQGLGLVWTTAMTRIKP